MDKPQASSKKARKKTTMFRSVIICAHIICFSSLQKLRIVLTVIARRAPSKRVKPVVAQPNDLQKMDGRSGEDRISPSSKPSHIKVHTRRLRRHQIRGNHSGGLTCFRISQTPADRVTDKTRLINATIAEAYTGSMYSYLTCHTHASTRS